MIDSFCKRMNVVRDAASENVKKATELHAEHYDQRREMVHYEIRGLVLLNTVNFRLKALNGKLPKRFIGPARIIERIRKQNCKLYLPNECKVHNVSSDFVKTSFNRLLQQMNLLRF